MNKLLLSLLAISLLLISPLVPAAHESPNSSHDYYTIGVVPQFEVRRLYKIWSPIIKELERITGLKFKIKGSPTIPEFEQEFMEGKFDFAYMNPYHSLIAYEAIGYLPLVRDIGRSLHGVLVVTKKSGINSPKELDGKEIAFPAPNALGASLQMRQELHDKVKISIQPKYVKTHDSVYLNVLLGNSAAGGGVQKTLNRQKSQYKNALKIIHQTQAVAPHPFVVHPRISKEIRARVQQAMLQLGTTKKGRALLSKIPMKKIGKASIKDYMPLKEMGLERFFVQSY
ncbi:MAG: phosphate/phosphite/phosphonate ABC transporter substrate-binding protein [Chromatiales bacterium]|nr:phosphate/phosphite/phosphonate ABC transporter substrate-binding protein [Chromatiales bacterium]